MAEYTLFTVPFLSGLLVASLLSAVGVLLRLRNEWLAALGFAHLAGASALVGLAIHLPAVLGATLGAVLGAAIKTLGRFRGNTVYALMILAGWSITLLVAANTRLGSVMGHAMVEGQLYFADYSHFTAAVMLAIATLAGLYWLMPILVRNRFFPGHDAANRLPAWRWHLAFDLLAALAMAVATATVGLMAAFALVFIPPWLAFRSARNWKQVLVISVSFGTAGYMVAFFLALWLDQPFGPVLVALLLVVAGVLQRLKPEQPMLS
ncbi:MAG: metal ABC transporter permease [Candidatus Thiodiazotropha sp.]